MNYHIQNHEGQNCGHNHRTLSGALRCLDKLQRTLSGCRITHTDGSRLSVEDQQAMWYLWLVGGNDNR